MKLPLKVEYACRVLVQLEPTFRSKAVRRIDDLAARESLSANYLVQILNDLRTAGIVQSRRGKNGGYLLARNPEEVTLTMIVNAVDGKFLELNSTGEGASGERVTRAWEKVAAAMESELSKHTLSGIAQQETAGIMWDI